MHPWSETSLVGSLYTRDYGKVSIVAKGARRPKSPFEAALDLLSVCRVLFITKSGDSLSILTEAKLLNRFRHVDRNLQRLYAAYYLVELLEKFTELSTPEPIRTTSGVRQVQIPNDASGIPRFPATYRSSHAEIFELASDTLRKLERQDCEARAVVLRLELQLLRLSGHLPSLNNCVHCGTGIACDRWIIYSPVSGGVLCPRCSTGGKLLMRIPPAVCEFLQRYAVVDWNSIPMESFPQENRAAIRAMMTKTISSLLDQRLKLQPYIEELGR